MKSESIWPNWVLPNLSHPIPSRAPIFSPFLSTISLRNCLALNLHWVLTAKPKKLSHFVHASRVYLEKLLLVQLPTAIFNHWHISYLIFFICFIFFYQCMLASKYKLVWLCTPTCAFGQPCLRIYCKNAAGLSNCKTRVVTSWILIFVRILARPRPSPPRRPPWMAPPPNQQQTPFHAAL